MLGIVFGTICLFALFRVLRHGGHGYGYGGYGYPGWYERHRRPFHYFTHHRAFGRGRAGRGMLRWVFWRLDATPGQEKVIAQEWDKLRDTLRGLRPHMRDGRARAAELIRGEHFDDAAIGALWQHQDVLITQVRQALVEAAMRIHDALDDEQRRMVAQWLEAGPRS